MIAVVFLVRGVLIRSTKKSEMGEIKGCGAAFWGLGAFDGDRKERVYQL